MKPILRVAATAAFLASLAACGTLQNHVAFTDVPKPATTYVTDHTKPDSYPAYLAGQGNDLSCRYGIHFQSAEEFDPPKAQLFAALLARELPAITTHQVDLDRFDVYHNHRLQSLHSLGSGGVGGVVGAMIDDANQRAAHQNAHVFTVDKLILDTDPMVNRHPGQNMVGCDDEHEGEYYPSEINGGNNVVVSWFAFSVDGKPYLFRTFYQVQDAQNEKEKRAAGIREAIARSIQAIATRITL